MTFFIPGVPIPMQRPRLSRKRVYNPQKRDKDGLHLLLKREIRSKQPELMNGAVFVKFIFMMPIPKSTPKKNNLDRTPHCKKPDIDNLIKFYLDLFIGLIFKDDNQVCCVVAHKEYATEPGVFVCVNSLERAVQLAYEGKSWLDEE